MWNNELKHFFPGGFQPKYLSYIIHTHIDTQTHAHIDTKKYIQTYLQEPSMKTSGLLDMFKKKGLR